MRILLVLVLLAICYTSEACDLTKVKRFVAKKPWVVAGAVVALLVLSRNLEGVSGDNASKGCSLFGSGKDGGIMRCNDGTCAYFSCDTCADKKDTTSCKTPCTWEDDTCKAPGSEDYGGSCKDNGITCPTTKQLKEGGGCKTGFMWFGGECDETHCCEEPSKAIDCEGSWKPCTAACEKAAARKWMTTTPASGGGQACPTKATDCGVNDGDCKDKNQDGALHNCMDDFNSSNPDDRKRACASEHCLQKPVIKKGCAVQCKCENGVPATDCTDATTVKCASCNNGSEPVNGECVVGGERVTPAKIDTWANGTCERIKRRFIDNSGGPIASDGRPECNPVSDVGVSLTTDGKCISEECQQACDLSFGYHDFNKKTRLTDKTSDQHICYYKDSSDGNTRGDEKCVVSANSNYFSFTTTRPAKCQDADPGTETKTETETEDLDQGNCSPAQAEKSGCGSGQYYNIENTGCQNPCPEGTTANCGPWPVKYCLVGQ